MTISVVKVHDSEKVVETGNIGVGSMSATRKMSSGEEAEHERAGEALLATRFFLQNFMGLDKDGSKSSLEVDGVSGGVGGREIVSLIWIRRRRETEIVASAAISRASDEDRGVVLKTTKYGTLLERE